MRIALCSLLVLVACSKKTETPVTTGPLTVGAYCSAFCGKLCDTCGDAQCGDTCKPRCLHDRNPDMLLDGKDPKVALALTKKNLDECLATISKDSCPQVITGQSIAPACFTMQH